jgi:hypothetical protein
VGSSGNSAALPRRGTEGFYQPLCRLEILLPPDLGKKFHPDVTNGQARIN